MKKIGIYPGSFNPFHIGHLDALLKAEKIFDEIVVAIGINPEKDVNSKINRLETLKFQLPGKNIEEYSGFLIDYVHKKEDEGYDVTIVRGLRNATDLEFEMTQLRILEDQYPQVKTIFLPCDRRHSHISSSSIRAMEKIQEGSASEYIVKPEMLEVNPRISLKQRYNLKNEEIKVGNTTFNFKLPKDFSEKFIPKTHKNENEQSVSNALAVWVKMINNKETNQDYWTEHSFIPGYMFKNLKIISNSDFENSDFENNVINVTFNCDEWKKIID